MAQLRTHDEWRGVGYAVLRLMPSDNYFLLLGVKMAIIFSLSPINQGIERHLLKKMSKKKRRMAAYAVAG